MYEHVSYHDPVGRSHRFAGLARRHGAAGNEPASLDDADSIANLLGDADAMGREKYRRALLGERPKQILELACALGIHPHHAPVDPGNVNRDAGIVVRAGIEKRGHGYCRAGNPAV